MVVTIPELILLLIMGLIVISFTPLVYYSFFYTNKTTDKGKTL